MSTVEAMVTDMQHMVGAIVNGTNSEEIRRRKMKKTVNIEISKKGIPCLWECGGGYKKTGDATVIAGKHGEAKKAIYVRTHGDLSCNDHALIPVQVGDYVINVDHQHGNNTIKIFQITGINLDSKIAESASVEQMPAYLQEAVVACVDKSYDYHCRTPYYCIY